MEKKVYETREESHEAYRNYVCKHIVYVQKAFMYHINFVYDIFLYYKNNHILYNAPIIDWDSFGLTITNQLIRHDQSKFCKEEFDAYAAKFYPCREDLLDKEKVDADFDEAWKHHWMNNRHHPEYWKHFRLVWNNGVDRVAHNEDEYHTFNINPYYLVECMCDWIGMSMNFKQSLYDWWFNNESGRAEKEKLIPYTTIRLIDELITEYKDEFDFSKQE